VPSELVQALLGLGARERWRWSAREMRKREEMRMRVVMAIRMINISIILELIQRSDEEKGRGDIGMI
jgi:hypothetical protein